MADGRAYDAAAQATHYRRGRSARKLIEQFGYKNVMQVPRLDKIVLNMGVGEAVDDPRRSTPPPPTWR